MADEKLYGSGLIMKATGATHRQIDHWCRRGYIRPVNPDEGSGRGRAFTRAEFQVAFRGQNLIHAGFVPKVAFRIAREDDLLYQDLMDLMFSQ